MFVDVIEYGKAMRFELDRSLEEHQLRMRTKAVLEQEDDTPLPRRSVRFVRRFARHTA